jgi:hypothetical protein
MDVLLKRQSEDQLPAGYVLEDGQAIPWWWTRVSGIIA